MKIAINASAMLGRPTGIGHYIRELVQHLREVPRVEAHTFTYLGQWDRNPDAASIGSDDRIANMRRLVPLSLRILARPILTTLRVGPKMRQLGIELYHEPNFLPVSAPCPVVITVQDLSFIRYADHHTAEMVRLLSRRTPAAVEKSQAVIVPSEFIRREVLELYATDPEKVHVTPYAASEHFHPRSPKELLPVLRKHHLEPGRYVLAVGTLEPRKNLIQALRAYQRLPAGLRERFPMTIVGMKGWETREFWKELAAIKRSGQVRLLGYVTDDELTSIYAGAAVFVYPSVYEGFGLPPLEAMASGVPVITSDRASLPEVVGDVGVQVAPEAPEPFAESLQWLLEDRDEAARRGTRGIERAQKFTWRYCAEQTAGIYNQVLQGVR